MRKKSDNFSLTETGFALATFGARMSPFERFSTQATGSSAMNAIESRRARPHQIDASPRTPALSIHSSLSRPNAETPLDRLRRIVPGVIRTAESGQHIMLEGDADGHVIGIISGLVRCFRLTTDGRRHICRFAGPGSLIGLASLGVQRHSAEAITPTQIVTFRAATLEAAMDRDILMRTAILQVLTDELSEGERIQLRLGCLTADQRVADFLLELVERDGEQTRDHDIPMSRADMADHLGMTIETVSRALHRFDKLSLIHLVDAHHFRLLSTNGLRGLIAGDDEPTYLRRSSKQLL